MADEQQFIEDGLQRTQIDEFFADELGRAGYGGMDVAKTPMGTQIVLKAEKPGMVIGKGGKNIRKITTTLEEEFGLEDPQVDVQEVDEPDLNARIVADRLGNALERGWYFRKAGHTTIDRIMEAGAKGAEIVLSGKVTGARSRVEKFNRGYIKHNGEPAENIVDSGVGVAVMKLGTIGVRVKIIPPEAELPDDFEIYEDVEVEDYVADTDGESVEELLEGEPEGEDAAAEHGAQAPADEDADEDELVEDVDEEVVEEATDEFDDVETPSDEDADVDIDDVEESIEEDLDEDTAAEAEDLIEEMDDADSSADGEEGDDE
ncbi:MULTISPECIES: 30S ribosomal protein S3 [Halomicrobium]|uniref:Small ribosomal subunit protein uS3 n=2 Tax=Halomicrobium mukohataei TaxID=57705 RepID=C7P4C6_HALMD|nr:MULTISPECIES: 30S ribosomal protein S3 [Halomicrobium]ACV47948.1 ribosomal protein S3 [Halomicrobium mukohataei DSM 12286]QCD66385.1 30S ribosomal protein S3 [Halomicrobium mukohataei]QFR21190.1 30S ribosomal protein S3 [Halomicrobium sp. ZPS1]